MFRQSLSCEYCYDQKLSEVSKIDFIKGANLLSFQEHKTLLSEPQILVTLSRDKTLSSRHNEATLKFFTWGRAPARRRRTECVPHEILLTHEL